MAGIRFTATIPRHYTDAAKSRQDLDAFLRTIAVEAQNDLRHYPPWQPWKNPPKTGLHAGGKRTGDLAKGWGSYQLESGRSVTLVNNVRYSPYVQGPEGVQARALAARGWPRVPDVARRAVQTAINKHFPGA